ncbi:hypothetical protein N9K06_01025 [Omnitrophica bacterium]|nr:hypothetical protein [Candidatus Omnitrophota bacterium]
MNHRQAIEVIERIEAAFDVNSLSCRNVRLWPMIRTLILWPELLKGHTSFRKKMQPAGSGKPSGKGSAVKNFFSVWKGRWKEGPILGRYRRILDRQLKELATQAPVEMVFFSKDVSHTDRLEEGYFDRICDPIIDLVKDRYRCLKLEVRPKQPEATFPRVYSSFFLNTIDMAKLVDVIEHGFVLRNRVAGFNAFNKAVAEIAPDLDLCEQEILLHAGIVFYYEEILRKVLTVLKPRTVFASGVTGVIPMGLILACRNLRIKTADIQHGQQGKYNVKYTHWTRVPQEGYELLPDYYWCWGKPAAENIATWFAAGGVTHQPIVGGNLWAEKWFGGSAPKLEPPAQHFLEKLEAHKKVLLVTLQPIESPLPAWFFSAVKAAPDDWYWLFRCHPVYRKRMGILEDMIRSEGIENCEWQMASDLPLYALLQKTNHHMTCWSTTGYEALLFNVPTTIIHPEGRKLFETYVKQGLFGYAETAEGLIDSLQQTHAGRPLREPVPFIETGDDVAWQALEKMKN